jgi:hypothetical protein
LFLYDCSDIRRARRHPKKHRVYLTFRAMLALEDGEPCGERVSRIENIKVSYVPYDKIKVIGCHESD